MALPAFENTLSFAAALDAADPLAHWREAFLIPKRNGQHLSYFLGNSLGLQPATARNEINRILQQWEDYGVEGFFDGDAPWMNLHATLAELLATLVGAQPSEVVVMNQLTVNLHLMMVSFYRPEGKRKKILCEFKAFPSDQYMLETHLRALGLDPDEIIIEVAPRAGEACISTEDIVSAIEHCSDELALVMFGGINYYTGQLFDMQAITAAAHAVGSRAGFDLAHAAGNVELKLHDWNIDFACWCNYKYLNGGPGAVGSAFIHERYHDDPAIPRFAGWWGYPAKTRFRMDKAFVPDSGASGWQLSTPPILLYAALLASLKIYAQAGWPAILEKSRLMNRYLWFLLSEVNDAQHDNFIQFITPREPGDRGNQVSMHMLRNGREIFDTLTAEGFITDWREPNVIRLAPVPLYNRFTEIWNFANNLQQVMRQYKPGSK